MKVWAAAELHERDAELKAVDSAIYAARAGHGCMLAIEGPPGIGKTSLVAIARDRARAAGMRVLAARGSELERDFAFGVVRQLLEPLVFTAEAAELERWFAGAAGQAAPLFKPAASVERSRE